MNYEFRIKRSSLHIEYTYAQYNFAKVTLYEELGVYKEEILEVEFEE